MIQHTAGQKINKGGVLASKRHGHVTNACLEKLTRWRCFYVGADESHDHTNASAIHRQAALRHSERPKMKSLTVEKGNAPKSVLQWIRAV